MLKSHQPTLIYDDMYMSKGRFKEIGDEEPCYSTKILVFSFIWAGLAALHKASTI